MDLVICRLASFARGPHMRTVLTCAVLLALASVNVFGQGGIIDTSEIQAQGNAFVRLFLWAAALADAVVLCWGVFKLFDPHSHGAGIAMTLGGVIAGIVIGHSLGWTSRMTGINVGQ